jgi:hypothetical protein
VLKYAPDTVPDWRDTGGTDPRIETAWAAPAPIVDHA